MSILVKSCGPQAEIVVRAVRLKRGLRRLTITYAADPYDTGESGVSGKRSSGIYGGLIPLTGLTWD
jgi:hypothetical protein